MKWEIVQETSSSICDRLRTPGGWILRTRVYSGACSVHHINVIDLEHKWEIQNESKD